MISTTPTRTTRTGPAGGREQATDLEVVPLQHSGRWVAAGIVALFTASFLTSLARNPNLEWDVVVTTSCATSSSGVSASP